jgi:hypothetical protein
MATFCRLKGAALGFLAALLHLADPPASDVDAITIIEGHADVARFDRKATMTALDGRLFHRRFTETMDTRGSGI